MFKDILCEIDVYSGVIKLPEPIEIDFETLRADILVYNNNPEKQFRASKSLDIISAYIRDFYRLKNKGKPVRQKDTFGYIQEGYIGTYPGTEVNLMELKNSPDYTFLFGVNIHKNSCTIEIEYDDNKFKDKRVEVPLHTNSYVMFPAHLRYHFKPNLSSQPNYILKQTYELN
jgi:hypothetical protein